VVAAGGRRPPAGGPGGVAAPGDAAGACEGESGSGPGVEVGGAAGHPYRPEFRLTSREQPAGRARDVSRFEIKLPAGKSASQTVTEESQVVQPVSLSDSDGDVIRSFVQSDVASPRVKDALRQALELKGKADRTRQELAHANQQLADIERDQQRIRANLKDTPSTAAASKKYLAKLDSQETDIDNLRTRIKKPQDDELAQRKDYDNFLAAVDVE
jgi:hypothetical protein